MSELELSESALRELCATLRAEIEIVSQSRDTALIQRLQADIEHERLNNQAMHIKLNATQIKLNDAMAQMASSELLRKAHEAMVQTLKAEVESLRRQLDVLQERLRQEEGERTLALRRVAEVQARYDALADEVEPLRAEKDALQRECAAMSRELMDARAELEALRNSLDAAKAQIASLELLLKAHEATDERVRTLTSEVESLRRQLDVLQERLRQEEAERTLALRRVAEVQARYDALADEVEPLRAEKDALQRECAAISRELTEMDVKLQQTCDDLSDREELCSRLQAKVAELEALLVAARHVQPTVSCGTCMEIISSSIVNRAVDAAAFAVEFVALREEWDSLAQRATEKLNRRLEALLDELRATTEASETRERALLSALELARVREQELLALVCQLMASIIHHRSPLLLLSAICACC